MSSVRVQWNRYKAGQSWGQFLSERFGRSSSSQDGSEEFPVWFAPHYNGPHDPDDVAKVEELFLAAGWQSIGPEGSRAWEGHGQPEEAAQIFGEVFDLVFHHGPHVPPALRTKVFIRPVAPSFKAAGSRFLFEVDPDVPQFWKEHVVDLIKTIGEIKWGLVASFPRHSSEQVAHELTWNGCDLIEDEERGEQLRQRAFDANGEEFSRLMVEPPHKD